jgi:DNA-binding NarL/FixJ family response regulator
MKPIRVLLVDDHELMRAGLRALLKELAEIEVVGEACNGREGLGLLETLQPEVVLMDVMMPEMNGLDATSRIVRKFPDVRVIVLSVNIDEQHVLQAVHAGASGYLPKNIGPAELEQAIRAVHQGHKHFSASVAKHLVTGLREGSRSSSLERLSPRQREILQLVAEGNTSKEIAGKLNISVKTAEMHRGELMKILDIHDVAGLVRFAIRVGLVSPDA